MRWFPDLCPANATCFALTPDHSQVGKARDRAARMNNRVAVKGGMIVGVAPSSYSNFKKPWDV